VIFLDMVAERRVFIAEGKGGHQRLVPVSARFFAALTRHTYLTRLWEAGMALEAVQARAGHASIESTRIDLHLADDRLAGQYRRAAEAIVARRNVRPGPSRTPGSRRFGRTMQVNGGAIGSSYGVGSSTDASRTGAG
jgi:site-specific recombinase XerC